MFVSTCLSCPPVSSSYEAQLSHPLHSAASPLHRPPLYMMDLLYPSIIPLPGTWQPQGYRDPSDSHRLISLHGKKYRQQTSKDACINSHEKLGHTQTSEDHKHSLPLVIAPETKSADLKFGIDRILNSERKEESHESEPEVPEESQKKCGFLPYGCSQSSVGQCSCPTSTPSHQCSKVYPPSSLFFHPGSQKSQYLDFISHRHHTPSHLRAHNPARSPDFPGPYSILSSDGVIGAPQPTKRKRSWSRAVFSNLQRKGLEKRFEVQKYVTKPDRRQLAAMLGLTDAQVKVWFQNRRMKWRHEMKKKSDDEVKSTTAKGEHSDSMDKDLKKTPECVKRELVDCASSDSDSDMEDIDIVEDHTFSTTESTEVWLPKSH